MKTLVISMDDFISERAKWNSPLNGLKLEDIKALPSYQDLISYGLSDISSELQKSRLNFRFEVLPYATKDIKYRSKEKVNSDAHLKLFDVNQRSGRIQAYVIPRSHGQVMAGGNMLKSLKHQLETLEDYDVMFTFLIDHINRKISKDATITFGQFSRNSGSFKYEKGDPAELPSKRVKHEMNNMLDDLWK